jgi:hypothetical protein
MASRRKSCQLPAISFQLALSLLWLTAESRPLTAQTVVSQSGIINADGSLASGSLRVWAAIPFLTPSGMYVGTGQVQVPIVNGGFTVALWPNDTGMPGGTYYYARLQLENSRPQLQIWYVPTCLGALNAEQVVATVSVVAGVLTVSGNACPGGTHLTWNQETGTWDSTSGTWASQ